MEHEALQADGSWTVSGGGAQVIYTTSHGYFVQGCISPCVSNPTVTITGNPTITAWTEKERAAQVGPK
jgi:hypothetical protein